MVSQIEQQNQLLLIQQQQQLLLQQQQQQQQLEEQEAVRQRQKEEERRQRFAAPPVSAASSSSSLSSSTASSSYRKFEHQVVQPPPFDPDELVITLKNDKAKKKVAPEPKTFEDKLEREVSKTNNNVFFLPFLIVYFLFRDERARRMSLSPLARASHLTG